MIIGTYFERKFKHRRETELAAKFNEGHEEGVSVGREEGRAAGRAQAIAEFNALLDKWEKRRDEAIGKGEPFDEPPPKMSE